jgi:hypothetical protein
MSYVQTISQNSELSFKKFRTTCFGLYGHHQVLRLLWRESSWVPSVFFFPSVIPFMRRPGFDSRHYQKKVVGLERGPLSLVSSTEELLDRKVAAVYKTENTAVGIRHADHVASSIRKSWQSLRRQAAVARSVYFARGLRPWSLVF